jgi:hypothetical protein
MLGPLRARFTFSNTVAVLALFVALGGSSYAALRVGSGRIIDNSVRSRDVRDDTLHGRDIRSGAIHSRHVRDNGIRSVDIRDGAIAGNDVAADTLTGGNVLESSLGTVPSAANAATLEGKSASAFLAADRLTTTGFQKLSFGQTKTVARSGPFTWNATCTDLGGGVTRLTVTLESTEAGAFAASFGEGGGPVSPGSPLEVFTGDSDTPVYAIGFPATAAAPSGAAPIGLGFVAIGVLGADCGVNILLTP